MADGLKDRDLQDYYESLLTMFATKGWTYFVEDLQRLFAAADSVQGVESLQELGLRQGTVSMIKHVVGQPAVVQNAYDLLLADEDESSV